MAKTKNKNPKSKIVGRKFLMRMNRVAMHLDQEDTMEFSLHKQDVCVRFSIPISQVGELFSDGLVEATITRWKIEEGEKQ